jgi:GTPase SAR1 family protein
VCALQGPDAPLDLNITILVIGLRGTGKTQLIHSLLGMSSSSSSSSSGGGGTNSSSSSTAALEPFGGGTRRVGVHRGRFLGVGLTLVDTPGLTSSAAGAGANAGVLRSIKAAFRKHQPDLVLYVDRLVDGLGGGGSTCGVGGQACFVCACVNMETTSVTYAADCFMSASVSISALCVHLFLQHAGTAAAAAAAASGLTPHTALAHDTCVPAGITRTSGPVIWLNSIAALTLSDASTAAAAAVGLMPHTALAQTPVC